jgi:hypothetical protein
MKINKNVAICWKNDAVYRLTANQSIDNLPIDVQEYIKVAYTNNLIHEKVDKTIPTFTASIIDDDEEDFEIPIKIEKKQAVVDPSPAVVLKPIGFMPEANGLNELF